MQRFFLFLLTCSLCLAGHAASLTVPGLTLPPDSGLARNEHPRLLFLQRDLPKYKERIAGPMKEDFQRFKSYMDERLKAPDYDWSSLEECDGVAIGVLYQLTGDKKYADALRRSSIFKNRDMRFWQYPFALDLVIDTMSRQEIQQEADAFLANLGHFNNPGYHLMALVLYGAGSTRDSDLAGALARGLDQANKALAYQDFQANDRGGDFNSMSYLGNHSVIHYAPWICGDSNALGRNYWQQHKWARHLGSYYVYQYFPWRQECVWVDNCNGFVRGPNGGEFGGGSVLAAAPAEYRDGLWQWLNHKMFVEEGAPSNDYYARLHHHYVMTRLWGKILFYDPKIPQLGPENFPPSRFFLTRGIASMREDWSTDATFVHFRCGYFGGFGDYRHNADNNAFSIYKKGILALDSGAQHMVVCGPLKFEAKGGEDSPHMYLYASETIAHNSILVRSSVDDAFWKSYGKANTGGQILRHWPAEWDAKRGFSAQDGGENAPTGKVLAWETSPEYDYVCGDASGSYSPESLKSFTRQLVYIRPNIIVVYDRVETANDGCQTSWLLHAADKPIIDGSETADTRIHPEGHFLWNGSVMTITDKEMGGRLFCKTLLPAKREMRLLGGEHHEFELSDGRNPGPTEDTYKPIEYDADLGQATKKARAAGVGLRGWRIEVDDTNGSRSNRFLHVLQTSDDQMTAMAPCQLVQKDGRATAVIDIDGRHIEVAFADSGDVAGHISVKKGGAVSINRALATRIEDDYQRWSNHPDYQKWTKDPFRQSVVLGTTPTSK